MNKFFVLSIFIYLLLLGCKTERSEIKGKLISEFPGPITLNGEKIPIENNEVYQPLYIEFIDSMLVISTSTDGKLISIYDKDGKYLSAFGRLGQGPNELNDTPVIYNYQKEGQETIVTTFDINLLILDKINLTKSMANNSLVIEETYEFPKESRRISSAFYVDSAKVIGVYEGQFYKNLDQRTGLFDFNSLTNNFKKFKLPNIDFEPSDPTSITYTHYLTRLNSRYSDLSASNSHMAVLMRYVPLLQIFEVGESTFSELGSYKLGEIDKSYDIRRFEKHEYVSLYWDLQVTDNYIYMIKNINYSSGDEPVEVHIEILNWEGVPQAVYKIPSRFDINAITVNEKDSIIYGLSYSQDAIYKFSYASQK